MHLNELSPGDGAKKVGKRRGRGHSAGQGKTCGRGQKGQHARSGGYHKVGFEGGQMPLARRLPKRGFTNIFRKIYRTVNVNRLNAFEAGSVIDVEAMQHAGLLRKGRTEVKILGNGDLEVALTVRAHKFTRTAAQKIEAAGGTIEQLVK